MSEGGYRTYNIANDAKLIKQMSTATAQQKRVLQTLLEMRIFRLPLYTGDG